MTSPTDNLPVIVGAGQLTSKVSSYTEAPSPLDMLEFVAQRAGEDAGPGSLDAVDTILAIPAAGWDEENPGAALADRLKLDVRRTVRTGGGGEIGVKMLNWLAEEILAGRTRTALLVTTNNMKTMELAAKEDVELTWPGEAFPAPELVHADFKKATHDEEDAAGITMPIHLYPIVENALRVWRGQTIEEHRQFMGRLFAPFTEMASRNPHAWFPEARTAEDLVEVRPDNRMVCFPYTKRLNAILQVDQAGAVMITSRGEARRLGIPEDQWVHWWGGGAKDEKAYYVSTRPNLSECPSMADSHHSALRNSRVDVDEIAAFDFYSCFPAAVEMAMKVLNISIDDPRDFTVTGGLPYAGGPGSGYTIQSLAAMAERLRTKPDDIAMVTGNGMYVSKHSATILSVKPPRAEVPRSATDGDLPSARMETEPLPIVRRSGRGTVDSYTVMHDRSGLPFKGVVVGRWDDGARFIADTPSDAEFLMQFEAAERIGTTGTVREGGPVLTFDPD